MEILASLASSAATEPFRQTVARFLESGRPCARLVFDAYAPPIKVERTLIKILRSFPELPIERVEIAATSGCDSFRGTASIEAVGETLEVAFEWNCRWKAEQLGWVDYFGFPDQARAAREFGFDCFRTWAPLGREPVAA